MGLEKKKAQSLILKHEHCNHKGWWIVDMYKHVHDYIDENGSKNHCSYSMAYVRLYGSIPNSLTTSNKVVLNYKNIRIYSQTHQHEHKNFKFK